MKKLVLLPLFLAQQTALAVQPMSIGQWRSLCAISRRPIGTATSSVDRRPHSDQSGASRKLPLGCSLGDACRNLQALQERLQHQQIYVDRVAKGRAVLKAQQIEPDQLYASEPQKMAAICEVEVAEIALIKSTAAVRAMKLAILHCQTGAAAGNNRCVLQGCAVATLTGDRPQSALAVSVLDHRN